jgi:prevent-host-death family protein
MTGICKFARHVSRYVERVETTGRPLVLTRHGKPVAALVAVDAGSLEDLILAHAPDFAASLPRRRSGARNRRHTTIGTSARLTQNRGRRRGYQEPAKASGTLLGLDPCALALSRWIAFRSRTARRDSSMWLWSLLT